MRDLDEEVRRALVRAGWLPGRRVDTSIWREELEASGLVMHDAAKGFLSEFGGLSFEYAGHGISRAREAFELDPLLASGEEDRFIEWSETIGKSIIPIGELDHGRFFLGIDEDATIYLVADWLAQFGTGRRGINCLILGVSPEPLFGGPRS